MNRLDSQLEALLLSFDVSEMKNFIDLSEGTNWLYQLIWVSLQAVQYTSQLIASKDEQNSTSLARI